MLTIARIAEIAKEVLGDAVSSSHDGARSIRFSVGETPLVDIEHMAKTAHYPVWYSRNLRRQSKSLRSEADVRKVFTDVKAMQEKDAAEEKASSALSKRRHALGEALDGIAVPSWCLVLGNVSPPESDPRPYRVTVQMDLLTEDQAVQVARAIATLATTLDVTQDGSQRDTAAAAVPSTDDVEDAAFWKNRYEELRAALAESKDLSHEDLVKATESLVEDADRACSW